MISPSDIFVDLFSSPVLSFIPPLLCAPAVAEQPSQEEQPSPGHLSPVALSNLSPQHCAVFLFGCQVVRLLSSSPTFPPVLLLLARSLPASSHDGVQLAHCAGDYYYDSSHQVLYLSEITLQDVGQFISTILQAMAYLSSGKSLDTSHLDPSLCKDTERKFAVHVVNDTITITFRIILIRYILNEIPYDKWTISSEQNGGRVVLGSRCVTGHSTLSGSKPQSFMQTLHKAISAISRQLFHSSFTSSASTQVFPPGPAILVGCSRSMPGWWWRSDGPVSLYDRLSPAP